MIKALAAGMLMLAGAITAPIALPALAVEPLNASAAETNVLMAADRIGGAFASLSDAAIDPAIASAAARAPKGDFAPGLRERGLAEHQDRVPHHRGRSSGPARPHHHNRLSG